MPTREQLSSENPKHEITIGCVPYRPILPRALAADAAAHPNEEEPFSSVGPIIGIKVRTMRGAGGSSISLHERNAEAQQRARRADELDAYVRLPFGSGDEYERTTTCCSSVPAVGRPSQRSTRAIHVRLPQHDSQGHAPHSNAVVVPCRRKNVPIRRVCR